MNSSSCLQLDDVQGNVLQGYGLRYAAYLNLQISNAHDGRGLLADLNGRVTDARRWWNGKPEDTLNLAVSHAGLERLGVSSAALDSFPPEFVDGMTTRAKRLGDVGPSAPEKWQPGLRRGEIHLLAVVHAASEDRRAACLDWLRERAAERHGITACDPELAAVSEADEREHFGFADGFGQPAVAGQTGPEYPGQGVPTGGRKWGPLRTPRGWRLIAPGEFILGYRDEDGVLPEAPVEPYGRNGTFMVYRKLKQDVVGFRRIVAELAAAHFDGDKKLVAAKIVGRWPDGTPLMLSPDHEDSDLARNKWRTNDFHYAQDPRGYLCPLGSHIRRANPRDGLFGGGDRTRRHRIIRRGMPYGKPLAQDTEDEVERGLLFICFNASIARQFEAVNDWLLKGEVFGLEHGDLTTDGRGGPAMAVEGDPPVMLRPRCARGPLVTTRGGDYLFLPGRRALAALADGDALQ